MEMQRLSSHPVHLVDYDGNLNPTALVPFCSVSDDYSAIGVKIDQMDVPVCNSFRPKIVRDQLCYSVDLNQIKHKISFKKMTDFSFFIDYNKERELLDSDNEIESIDKEIKNDGNGIIIETIGIKSFNSQSY